MASILKKIAGVLLLLVVLGATGMAFMLSRETACGPAPAVSGDLTLIKAVVRRCYGPPDVLELADVEKPVPADNQVLVRVRAAGINPLDWHYMRGNPYLMRLESGMGAPRNPRLGVDFAGTVEAVGKDVTRFRPGDEVFGGKFGALAEFIAIPENGLLAGKPDRLTFEQAGGVDVAGLTALQALRDRAQVRPGQKVLINGASGGVGTFAVQIAKALGAEVTGVSSTRNLALVRSLGADHVVDYTQEDFTAGSARYDVVLDNVGNLSPRAVRRVLTPQGKFVLIGGGGPDAGPWIGVFLPMIKTLVLSWFVDQDMGVFLSHSSAEDLAVLRDMMQDGRVTPVVDRTYPLAEVADAMRYLEAGHARGKVIVTVD